MAFSDMLTFLSEAVLKPTKAGGLSTILLWPIARGSFEFAIACSKASLSPKPSGSKCISFSASIVGSSDILTFFSEAVLRSRKAVGLFGTTIGSTSLEGSSLHSKDTLSPKPSDSVYIIFLALIRAFSEMTTFFSEAVLKPTKVCGLFPIW